MKRSDAQNAATGRYELRISLPSASRDDAMGLARKALDVCHPYAESVVVFEEQTEPKMVQCGSTFRGVTYAR